MHFKCQNLKYASNLHNASFYPSRSIVVSVCLCRNTVSMTVLFEYRTHMHGRTRAQAVYKAVRF